MLERTAENIVSAIIPSLLEQPGAFPAADFFEFDMRPRFGLKAWTDNLPTGVEGMTGPGREIILSAEVYEQLRLGQGRARFTALHECAHGILHLSQIETMFCELMNGHTPRLYRRQQLRAFEDPEWQADWLAAAILMPRLAMKLLVNREGFNPTSVMSVFGVTRTAAEKRLRKLAERGWLA